MALFYSNVPVSHDSVSMSQHAQYQDSETEAAEWNVALINFAIHARFSYCNISTHLS